jgi:hypothetical protein
MPIIVKNIINNFFFAPSSPKGVIISREPSANKKLFIFSERQYSIGINVFLIKKFLPRLIGADQNLCWSMPEYI